MTTRLVLWLGAVMLLTAPMAGAQTDTIHGRISDQHSAPVVSANVTITALPDHVIGKTRSDKGGTLICGLSDPAPRAKASVAWRAEMSSTPPHSI
jgi:hypothetical protein